MERDPRGWLVLGRILMLTAVPLQLVVLATIWMSWPTAAAVGTAGIFMGATGVVLVVGPLGYSPGVRLLLGFSQLFMFASVVTLCILVVRATKMLRLLPEERGLAASATAQP